MDYPEGTVVAVRPGVAIVSVDAAVACERCATGRGCGAALPVRRRQRRLQVAVGAELNLAAGDTVRLALEPARLVRAAWLAYGLPLLGMVAAVAMGSQSVASDAGAAAFGVGGLIAGALTGRHILRKSGVLRQFTPVAIERSHGAAERLS